jgi:hypothetical protein
MILPLSEKAQHFKPGIYRHYKNKEYQAFFVARQSEAVAEEVVVYQALADGQYWVRPLDMFLENVEVDGLSVPRFKWVGDAISD